MIQNFIRHKMAGYLRQAELFGDMRRVWAKHVWWTREVIISIINGLPSTQTSVDKLLKNPVEMAAIFGQYYSDATQKKIQDLFTIHLKMGGDIVTAAKAGDMAKVEDLTKQWYANADDIAKLFASINPHYELAEVRAMMYEHLRLTLLEASSYLKGDYNASIAYFDQIQREAEKMADMFAMGITKQFPDSFR